jgi:hypothetical protein
MAFFVIADARTECNQNPIFSFSHVPTRSVGTWRKRGNDGKLFREGIKFSCTKSAPLPHYYSDAPYSTEELPCA